MTTKRAACALVLMSLGLGAGSPLALAQSSVAPDWPTLEAQVFAGSRNAIIEGTCASGGQALVGGALRYRSPGGMGVGIEVTSVRACDRQVFTYYHPRMTASVQLLRDLGQFAYARPYVLGGVGVVRHRSLYAPAEAGGEFVGGAGVNIRVARRVVVTSEYQLGGPVYFSRFTIGVGILAR